MKESTMSNLMLGALLVAFSISAGIFSCYLFDKVGTPSELFTLIGGGTAAGMMLIQSGIGHGQKASADKADADKLKEEKIPPPASSKKI